MAVFTLQITGGTELPWVDPASSGPVAGTRLNDDPAHLRSYRQLFGPTTLTITRGAGTADGGCRLLDLPVAWERVDFGTRASVQTITTTLPAAALFVDVAVAPVDLTRTLVLSGAQTVSGQSGGESAENVSNLFGSEASARFELTTATNVRVTREHASAAATFTFYVIQVEP